jgi:hypothetical protein
VIRSWEADHFGGECVLAEISLIAEGDW